MESKVTQAKEKKEQLFMQSKHSANRISAETQKQSDKDCMPHYMYHLQHSYRFSPHQCLC